MSLAGVIMRSFARKIAALAATTFQILAVTAASAQPEASGASVTSQPASTGQSMSKAEQKKQAKAQRKAERKAAHAKNTAELKELQKHGYSPSMNDPNYPENLQNARKKANGAVGATSQ